MTKQIRICVLGNSGSGKSTLAKILGQRLNIPVYHLDRELLVGNYEKLPFPETQRLHQQLADKPSWIIDGNYHSLLPERVLKATLVVFINTGRLVSLTRFIRRAKGSGQDRDTIPSEAPAKQLSWNILRYVAGYSRRKRRQSVEQLCHKIGVPLLVLKSASADVMAAQVLKKLGQ